MSDISKRIFFIGGGNIAEAIFSGLDHTNIYVIQRNEQKRKLLENKYPHITFSAKLNITTTHNDYVILAVKPQDAKETCKTIKYLVQQSNIITVMSGVTTETLTNWLEVKSITRAMPNSPAMLKKGVTGLYFNNQVPKTCQEFIKNIFSTIGSTYIFNDEDFIDKITATAGSAPAYVYYLMEQMITTAVEIFNFDPISAKQITLDVFKGAVEMVENQKDLTINELRHNVTSKKGTTAAAIKVFEAKNFKEIVANAMVACYNRAKEISFQNS